MRLIHLLNKYHYLVILIELILVLMLLVFTGNRALSQDKGQIHGIIFEHESGIPLSGAHILVFGTSYGTISGPDGSFRLGIKDYPVRLKISHIGFDDRLFLVEERQRYDTLMLGMHFSAQMLEGVTVTDKRAELIFKDELYSVQDFEFHENGLMLLIFRNRLKRSELILLSYLNDTLAQLNELPGRARSLHRDCMDYIHYISDDTAYQIHFDGTHLLLVHPTPFKVFKPVADAFVARIKDHYYFALRKMHDQVIEYVRYDSSLNTYASFRKVADNNNLRILAENPEHSGMLKNLVSDRYEFNILKMGVNESIEDQKTGRDMERSASIEAHYLRECVYHPIYAPLFKYKDEFVLFNHPQSSIEFLTPKGKVVRSTNISYHNMENWDELILKDEIQDKYYAVFKKQNRISLCSVYINTGLLGTTDILYFPFIKKIRIRNGYVYFTYRRPDSHDRTMLFRQRLRGESNSYADYK